MARILVLESKDRTIRVVETTLAVLGYQLSVVRDPERLKLEIRKHQPDLILASADLIEGSGLDFVRRHYAECSEAAPVIAYSGYHTRAALRELTPVELLLSGVLVAPLDPGELARLVSMVCPPKDAASAVEVVLDLAGEDGSGIRLHEPSGTQPLGKVPLPRLLCAVDFHDWSGCLRVEVDGGASWSLFFEFGQLVCATSSEGRDLIAAAQRLGRTAGVEIPDVPVRNLEEEIGLLLAMRVIGMHETEWICEQAVIQLLAEVLVQWDGVVVAIPGLESEDQFAQPMPVLPIVIQSVRHQDRPKGESVLEAHPESVLVVRLPNDAVVCSWALPETEEQVIGQLALARSKEITLGQLLRVVAGDDSDRQTLVEAVLALLVQIGYVHLSGRPWGEETTAQLAGFVRELHRLAKADHFEVLGVKRDATEKQIRAALREVSLKYHPDTLYDRHPRVQETANALYTRVQEAYETLRDAELRDSYRAELDAKMTSTDMELAKVSLARGKIRLRHKRYADAAESFYDATLHDPGNTEAKIRLAWTRFLADPSEARRAMAELSTIIKSSEEQLPDAWYYLGRLALLQDNYGKARSYFGRALRIEESHTEALREIRLMDRRGQAVPEAAEPSPVEEEKEKPKGFLAKLRGR